MSGNDARFYPADAVINGNSITLSSTYVSAPVAVRYGYGTFFRVNLFNKAGLPAVPFRTDTLLPTLIIVCLPIRKFVVSRKRGSWIMENACILVMRKE